MKPDAQLRPAFLSFAELNIFNPADAAGNLAGRNLYFADVACRHIKMFSKIFNTVIQTSNILNQAADFF